MSKPTLSRRAALKAGAAAIAAPTLIPASALGRDGAAPPSETVRVGVIGCGARARMIRDGADVKGFSVVAVADCLKQRAEDFSQELSGGKWKAYEDFRQMIDAEQLDGVMVETTTHARAWVAIHAMQMGMDAYIEKPMALTIAEGRAMVDAARASGSVTQVGTQQRSMPINNWASDLVKNGAIGKVKAVLAPNFIGPFRWEGPPAAEATGKVDPWWDVWTNQAELRPYDPQLHLGWARWRAYDSGGLCFGVSGWGAHSYDQILRALGADETGPVQVELEEELAVRDSGRFAPQQTVGGVSAGIVGDVDTGAQYHGMAKLAGPRARVRMTMADGAELLMHLDGDRGPGLGAIFVGENGKIEINRNRVASNPKELTASADNPGPNTRPETAYHIENWVDCIKTRQRCTADIEYGQRANSLCELVNIARNVGRVGEPLAWDPAAERFTNNDEANAMLSRPRRAGWELPAVG
ncbi:Glucose--fructose oxidoreductase precursor [Posidoniimonas corsicana]|uniref:Glucose--fructose oxidoreductase n=1 Tax=Posidoniimonas corsicana TaxID=1938618 RepID=A0A5C5V6M4_9BACT|nr:Gfo/Idh/MocA family oxidoreductase [Posidoniimonas corsicana]TWT33457.1 Glucose--fructose oxidoreductase precursor [Posidoniimonas corsicana]